MRKGFDPADPDMILGPYGRVGSVFNVIACGALGLFTLLVGILQQQPSFFIGTVIAVVLEIAFIRVTVRTRRRVRQRETGH